MDDILIDVAGENNIIVGGDGVDTVSFENHTSGVDVELASGNTLENGVISDIVADDIENVKGSAFNDIITGSTDDNHLDGGDGNDIIDGFGGNNVIDGGAGNDTISGGDGADVFVFTPDTVNPDAFDNVLDFNPEEGDKIDLSAFAGELRTSVDLRSELVNGGTLMHLPDGQAAIKHANDNNGTLLAQALQRVAA